MSGTPIVVGYDGSPGAEMAVRWAVAEAARLRAPVRVVLVLQWPAQLAAMIPGPPLYPDEMAQRTAEAMVAATVRAARRDAPTVTVTGHVRIGATVPDLVAESSAARLMVLGHREHPGLVSVLSGSVGLAVSAQAHCPVVIIRGRPGDSAQVLVGFDGSSCAPRALDVAFQAATARGLGVHILHAWRPPASRWRPPEGTAGADRADSDQVERLALAEHIAVVDAIQPWRRAYPRVPLTVDLVADGAGHALVAASAAAQLVVVGSCGHGSLRGLLFGSVSRQLVHRAGCPVVVVHELPRNEVSAASA